MRTVSESLVEARGARGTPHPGDHGGLLGGGDSCAPQGPVGLSPIGARRGSRHSMNAQQMSCECVCACSVVSDPLRPHGLYPARLLCRSLSPSSLKLMSIESVMPSNHLILCCLLLLLPSILPSIKVFSSESVLCFRWPKYWSFSISLSNEYSGLISFRMDWFDLLAGTLQVPGLISSKGLCVLGGKRREALVG